jgi:hypothetical protein
VNSFAVLNALAGFFLYPSRFLQQHFSATKPAFALSTARLFADRRKAAVTPQRKKSKLWEPTPVRPPLKRKES